MVITQIKYCVIQMLRFCETNKQKKKKKKKKKKNKHTCILLASETVLVNNICKSVKTDIVFSPKFFPLT